jgi:hypothetical protein
MHVGLAIGQSDMQPTQNTAGGAMGARREIYAQFFMEIFACFSPNQDLTLLLFVFRDSWSKMTVTWREREHEEEDMLALHDPVTVNALRNCGLFKFFRISSMRQQINLLQYFLDAWDPTSQVFQIRGKSIPLTVVDIYFLTGLSRRVPLSHYQVRPVGVNL